MVVESLCSSSRSTANSLRRGRPGRAAGRTLHSYTIGVLPILDRFFDRLRLKAILRDHLPPEDRRCRIATATGLLLLLKTSWSAASPSTDSASGPRGTSPNQHMVTLMICFLAGLFVGGGKFEEIQDNLT